MKRYLDEDTENLAYTCLAAAIVEQAAKDYIKGRQHIEYGRTFNVSSADIGRIKSSLIFFKSPWYENLSNFDSMRLLKMIDDEYELQNRKKTKKVILKREGYKMKIEDTHYHGFTLYGYI